MCCTLSCLLGLLVSPCLLPITAIVPEYVCTPFLHGCQYALLVSLLLLAGDAPVRAVIGDTPEVVWSTCDCSTTPQRARFSPGRQCHLGDASVYV